jgi:hypothetical protein
LRSHNRSKLSHIWIGVDNSIMVWLWARGQESLQLETRYDTDSAEFVMTLMWPDNRVQVERFTDLAAFRARLVEMEQKLKAERWKNAGPPVILADGWPHRWLT